MHLYPRGQVTQESTLGLPTPAVINLSVFAPQGSSACTACAQGRYSLAQDANCYDCPKGNYQNAEGQSTCLACNQNNQYQDQTGQSTCKLCNAAEGYEQLPTSLGAGSTPFSPGYTGCSKCEDGWYLNGNTRACERCPDNYIADALNDYQSCKSCPLGTYRSNSNDMGQCETCPSGYQAISNDPFGCAIYPLENMKLEVARRTKFVNRVRSIDIPTRDANLRVNRAQRTRLPRRQERRFAYAKSDTNRKTDNANLVLTVNTAR